MTRRKNYSKKCNDLHVDCVSIYTPVIQVMVHSEENKENKAIPFREWVKKGEFMH